jgi:hypothetical protein
LTQFPPKGIVGIMSESPTAKGAYRLRPDAKGRITLGKLAEGVSSYRATRMKDGKIVLEPFIEIPAEERWLWENKEALASVLEGIEDARAGRVTRMTFKKYLK